MKIATTTGDFSFYCKTDEEKILELYNAGFRYIDLDMYSFTPDSVYMKDNYKEEVYKIKDLAEKLGMQFVQAHSQGGNPLSLDKWHSDFIIKATIRSIEICQMLGIKNTVSHNGVLKGASKEEWFVKNKEFYNNLIPTIEKCGVNLLCENSTKSNMGDCYFINSGKDMSEFIKFVDHPLIHGCWDTGHANCEGNQYDDIMAVGKDLYAIHYNDNHGYKDDHVAPFLGILNHDEVMTALIDVGFKGYFTLECDSSLIKYNQWTGKRRRWALTQPCFILVFYQVQRLAETVRLSVRLLILRVLVFFVKKGIPLKIAISLNWYSVYLSRYYTCVYLFVVNVRHLNYARYN